MSIRIGGFAGLPALNLPTPRELEREFQPRIEGDKLVLSPQMPKYPGLDNSPKGKLEALWARYHGRNQQLEQPAIQDAGGQAHEPITLVVTGDGEALKRALQGQGWQVGESASEDEIVNRLRDLKNPLPTGTLPFSNQYLPGPDGKPVEPAFVMSKNNRAGGLARDHIRVYPLPPAPDGTPRWGIAATRDTDTTIRKGADGKLHPSHKTDRDLDQERDLLMRDLQESGVVGSWAIKDGVQPGGKPYPRRPEDGRTDLGDGFYSDGKVYDVRIK